MSNISTGENEILLFTYGTLKRGHYNNKFLDGAEFIGEAIMKGFEMYSNGAYPMIVEGDGIVYGEVYKVNLEDLLRIDRLEEYREDIDDGVYLRRKGEVELKSGEKVDVEYYLWNRSILGLKKIERGEFK